MVQIRVGNEYIDDDDILDYFYINRYNQQVDQANIQILDRYRNEIEKGEKIYIESNRSDLANILWQGRVQQTNTSSDGEFRKMTIKAQGESQLLKYMQVDRPFFEKTYAQIAESMVKYKAEYKKQRYMITGDPNQTISSGENLEDGYVDSVSGWESNIPELTEKEEDSDGNEIDITKSTFQRLDSLVKYHNAGSDVLGGFLKTNLNGEYYMRKTDIDGNKFFDGFSKVFFRFFPYTAGNLDFELEISDNENISYVWKIDSDEVDDGSGNTLELKLEEASSENSKLTNKNEIELRILTNGPLKSDQAVGIDFLKIIPFQLEEREDAFDSNRIVGDTKITTRVSGNVDQKLRDFALEERATYYVDRNREFNFVALNQNNSSVNIRQDKEDIIKLKVDRDYKDIKNSVTVIGNNNVKSSLKNQDSIEEYGIKDRHQDIVDKEIQKQKRARRRAEGFLEEHAFRDTMIKVLIGGNEYQDERKLTSGQRIYVDVPAENLGGTYRVEEKKLKANGVVDLKLVNLEQENLT